MAKLLFVAVLLVVSYSGLSEAKLQFAELSDELKDLLNTLHATCVAETGVDEAAIKKADNGEFDDSDDKLKCYLKCLYKETGSLDDDGKIDFTPLAKILPEDHKEAIKKMVDTCVKNDYPKDDLCELTYNLMKCAHAEDPEHFFVY